jgi:sigma-B regulation protein RsbU (phosphoserine phosphatase)
MSQRLVSGALSTGLVIDVEPQALTSQIPLNGLREQELELKLAELQRNYTDLHAALFEASQVYRRLCAPRLVHHGNFEIASETFAARHLPGDFFTVREAGDGGVMFGLGDISGKGLAAGMWTALFLGLLNLHSDSDAEPETIVAAMNRDLCRSSVGAPLASLFLASLNSNNGVLNYCSAGHPPALLLRADGQLESLSDGGPLLGVVPEAVFVKGTVTLRVGDALVVYSDGILEARNDDDQEFGFDGLEAQLRRTKSGSANAVLFSVLGAVQDFVGGYPQADDMSFVVVQRRVPRRHW